jgi:hypothetical protein
MSGASGNRQKRLYWIPKETLFGVDCTNYGCDCGEQASHGSGDINQDGGINVLDLVALVNCVLSEQDNSECTIPGDMNQDGTLNILDVVALSNIILNNPQTTSEDRKEVEYQLSRLYSVGGNIQTIKVGDVVKDMNST